MKDVFDVENQNYKQWQRNNSFTINKYQRKE